MRAIPLMVCLGAALAVAGSDVFRKLPSEPDSMREAEVSVFEGGYGISWHLEVARRFNAEHAGENMRVRLWGDPRNADILKPRLLRGDPPDLILNERLPIWQLIQADKLVSFREALEGQPPLGVNSTGAWGDAFHTGMLDMFRSGEEVYAIPAAYGAWLCWYDARLFAQHGWTPPRTWGEFLALCDRIGEEGIAPLALQGKYSNFYAWNTFVSLVHRVGGLAAINRINALEPGAFSHPDAVRAAGMFQDLFAKHFRKGALAMTHTESQLEFVHGETAMVFCGIWLENEMKESLPPDFELRCFPVPEVEDGRGNPRMLHGQGMEFLFIPRDAPHPDIALKFARYLVSPRTAPSMGRKIGVISPLRNATPRDSVSPALRSALDVIDASEAIYNVRVRLLFPQWTAETMGPAITALLRGEITPAEFARRLDEGIAEAVAGARLAIPPHVEMDPAVHGEAS